MNRLTLIVKQRIISVIMLIISVTGGIFIYLYLDYMKSSNTEIAGQKIIVMNADIEEGEIIDRSDISIETVPEEIFSDSYLVSEESVIGKIATEEIIKGEILTKDKIEGYDDGPEIPSSISSYIPINLKAVSVPLRYYGNTDFLNKGDRIDIVSVYYDDEKSMVVSETILRAKELISLFYNTDNSIEGDEGGLFFESFETPTIDKRGDITRSITGTFYLDEDETEAIFLALEKGVLNVAICSKKRFGGI